jgi:hypothetical protein
MNATQNNRLSIEPKSWMGILLALIIVAVASFNAHAQLPDPGMEIVPGRTAVLITDPQNDFLSPDGVTWGVVGNSAPAGKSMSAPNWPNSLPSATPSFWAPPVQTASPTSSTAAGRRAS